MCYAQGKIVLVGGGSESDASYAWSNAPYQWAIDESANKKVAVISYDHSGSVDAQGNCSMIFNSEGMYRGSIGDDGKPRISFYDQEVQ